MHKKLFVTLIFLSPLLYSQKAEVDYYFKKYPNEAYINLYKIENTTISIEKNNVKIVQHHHEKLMILKGNLNRVRSKKVLVSSFIKVENLKANLFVYNGKTHKKQKITNIQLESENDGGSTFFDDHQYYTINFLTAKEGDIIEVDYDQIYIEPRFFDASFISDYSPLIHYQSSVTYPINQVNFKLKELNNQKLDLRFKEDSTKKTKTLTWTADSVEALKDEYLDAPYRYKASYILMAIQNYKTKDSVVNVGGSLENLYHWYRNLIKNVDLTEDDHLASLTDSLIQGQPNDLEKMKQLFYWVQSKIAYLAYEDGLGGFIPREASVVCKRRFGDCKDMANLIVRMGKYAKLPIYPVWIGTRSIPYQFSEFPAPFCANHMIAAYLTDKDTLFLDATGKNHSYDLPTAMIQGKEGLIGVDSVNFVISKVPIMPKSKTTELDSIVLTLRPDNRISGEGYYQLTGYEKMLLSNYLDKNSYQKQKNYLKNILEKGNNKFKLDTFFVLQNDQEKPLTVFYKFVISDYFTQNKDQIFINLNFFKEYLDKLITAKRQNAFDFQYRVIHSLSVTLNLNQKYKIDHIPENASYITSTLGFEYAYKATEESIYFKNTISINELSFQPENFAEVDRIVSSYKKTKSNVLSLTQKK